MLSVWSIKVTGDPKSHTWRWAWKTYYLDSLQGLVIVSHKVVGAAVFWSITSQPSRFYCPLLSYFSGPSHMGRGWPYYLPGHGVEAGGTDESLWRKASGTAATSNGSAWGIRTNRGYVKGAACHSKLPPMF